MTAAAAEPLTDAYVGGSGSPMILLHGINGSWRIWRPVLPELEKRHALFVPTLIGHRGGPPLAPGPNGIGVIADDIEARMDKAGIARAHLVGNSLGGWLALELAARGRGLSVVDFSPAGTYTSDRDLRRIGTLLKLARSSANRKSIARLMNRPGARKALLRSAMLRGDLIPAEDIPGMNDDLKACTMLDGLLASLKVTGPTRELKIPVDCPVRIVWAERDRTIPWKRYGEPWRAVLPDAEFLQLPGIGHVPMYDDPSLVVRTILEFTDRVDHPAPSAPQSTEESA
jgi:pimeloyl-ACP methyl ester carboxylesterase